MNLSQAELPPSRFPLPLSAVERGLRVVAQFSDAGLDLLRKSNGQELDPLTPLGHMWNFREEPGLRRTLTRYVQPPFDESLMIGPWRNYRAVACIGDILVRSQEDRLADQGVVLPPVQLSPYRQYLSMPEVITGRSAGEHVVAGHYEIFPLDYHAQLAVERGYLDESDAVHSLEALRAVWLERKNKILHYEGASEAVSKDLFSNACRNMFDLFRLYRIGEHEGRVAPWDDTVYDPAKHLLLDDDLHYKSPTFHVERRWMSGLTAIRAGASREKELWGYALPRKARLTSVARMLTGVVEREPGGDALYEVGYRASIERFPLLQDDVLIVQHQPDEDDLSDPPLTYHQMRYPFENPLSPSDKTSYAVVAICRNGKAALLRQPPADTRQLAAILDHTLTGGSILYTHGVAAFEDTIV